MAERGAQPGNDNATKGAECKQALKRALAHKSGQTFREGLDLVMTKYVEAACNGEPWAMRDIQDRLDGKPAQGLEVSGPDGGPVETQLNYIPICQQSDK